MESKLAGETSGLVAQTTKYLDEVCGQMQDLRTRVRQRRHGDDSAVEEALGRYSDLLEGVLYRAQADQLETTVLPYARLGKALSDENEEVLAETAALGRRWQELRSQEPSGGAAALLEYQKRLALLQIELNKNVMKSTLVEQKLFIANGMSAPMKEVARGVADLQEQAMRTSARLRSIRMTKRGLWLGRVAASVALALVVALSRGVASGPLGIPLDGPASFWASFVVTFLVGNLLAAGWLDHRKKALTWKLADSAVASFPDLCREAKEVLVRLETSLQGLDAQLGRITVGGPTPSPRAAEKAQ